MFKLNSTEFKIIFTLLLIIILIQLKYMPHVSDTTNKVNPQLLSANLAQLELCTHELNKTNSSKKKELLLESLILFFDKQYLHTQA
jgi:hypothetical protein